MAFQPNDDAACLSIFRQNMDEMFDYMFRMRAQVSCQQDFLPSIDIYESCSDYVIEIDLPGFSENDFSLTTIGSTLRIEGIKRHEKTESAVSYICLERQFGKFSRNLDIPEGFDPGKISTTHGRGVLCIRIGKKQ